MSTRPFVVIDNLERAAEHKFRAKEQELRDKLADTEKKLRANKPKTSSKRYQERSIKKTKS